MRNLPALIVAVLMGGLILFGLLWLWFWFEQNSSSRGGNGYSSQDQSGYSSSPDTRPKTRVAITAGTAMVTTQAKVNRYTLTCR